ncbi:hypothetical protein [Streptomyces sp. NPDC004726]
MTNTERAMVMPLEREGDPGGHAVDPEAGGPSDGFALSYGQYDKYPDKHPAEDPAEDTVPIGEAFGIVEHIVGTGSPARDRAPGGRSVKQRPVDGPG